MVSYCYLVDAIPNAFGTPKSDKVDSERRPIYGKVWVTNGLIYNKLEITQIALKMSFQGPKRKTLATLFHENRYILSEINPLSYSKAITAFHFRQFQFYLYKIVCRHFSFRTSHSNFITTNQNGREGVREIQLFRYNNFIWCINSFPRSIQRNYVSSSFLYEIFLKKIEFLVPWLPQTILNY